MLYHISPGIFIISEFEIFSVAQMKSGMTEVKIGIENFQEIYVIKFPWII